MCFDLDRSARITYPELRNYYLNWLTSLIIYDVLSTGHGLCVTSCLAIADCGLGVLNDEGFLSAAATDDTGDDASNDAKCWDNNENDNQPSGKSFGG